MGKNVFLRALVVLGATCLAAASTNAGERYFTQAVVYTDDDDDRGVDDAVRGGQIGLGWVLSKRWSMEAAAGYSDLGGINDLKIYEGSLNFLVSLSPKSVLSPYLIGGVGMMNTDSLAITAENSSMATAGAGLMLRFGKSPVSLRLEYRRRYELGNTLYFEDQIASVGLQFRFGGAKESPPPAPAPAPENIDGDADGDGVADSRDACPNTAAGTKVDARGCLLDRDKDRVTDDVDQCPNTASGATVDSNGCEIDSDQDHVVDRLDACPNTRAGVRVDLNGCEIQGVINLPGVNFQSNSDRLLPGSGSVLNDAAQTLRMNPDLVIEVAGHTDSAGSAEHNAGLSERRATTVRDYLVRAGVNAQNLTAKGYGEANPIADNSTADGRARNRRVELRILNR